MPDQSDNSKPSVNTYDMDQKLNESIAKYRSRLTQIQAEQRTTKPLGENFVEQTAAGGKRIKVVERHRKITVEPRNDSIDLTTESDGEDDSLLPVLIYPKERGAIKIYRSDLERLKEGSFLNDQLINVMLQWFFHQEIPLQQQQDIYLCDSFFYAQLVRGVGTSGSANEATLQQNFERASEWFRSDCPFDKDLVLIPICEQSHWFLVAVIVQSNGDSREASILVMDSLAVQERTQAISTLCGFINATRPQIKVAHTCKVQVRQQRNGYDCGLHVLHNAQRFLQHISKHPATSIGSIFEEINAEPWPITRKDIANILRGISNNNSEHAETAQVTPEETPATITSADTRNLSTQEPEISIPAGQNHDLDMTTILRNRTTEVWSLAKTDLQSIKTIEQRARQDITCHKRRLLFQRSVAGYPVRFCINKSDNVCIITKQ